MSTVIGHYSSSLKSSLLRSTIFFSNIYIIFVSSLDKQPQTSPYLQVKSHDSLPDRAEDETNLVNN